MRVAYLIQILVDDYETVAVCLDPVVAVKELIRHRNDDPMNIYQLHEMEITE